VQYQKKELAGHTSRKSLASSTMIASGLLVMVFVVIHVKQFKYGSFYLAAGSDSVRDLYRTEIEVFRNPLWVAFYVAATLLVGLHMRHGIASACQSLGLDHPRYTGRIVGIGIAVAVAVAGGLAVIPIWAYLTHY
jgi:succinate dehydrogenase / fumarate reductase cytochrome b subunit